MGFRLCGLAMIPVALGPIFSCTQCWSLLGSDPTTGSSATSQLPEVRYVLPSSQ